MSDLISSHPLPSRSFALGQLDTFCAKGLTRYSAQRNFDPGPAERDNVSDLSPFIRQRIITEKEVLSHALNAYPLPRIDKFVQEVFWRTYWKGWLEIRPGAWENWKQQLAADHKNLARAPRLAERWQAARKGETDIPCFNDWVQELKTRHTLHNHTRMWFASIWIFTLRLPWSLGAEFFLEQLFDGDPASNTLSWRWVAGLQTKGKHYVARASNIREYTGGRHNPDGLLNESPEAITESVSFEKSPPPVFDSAAPGHPWLLILHNDDLSPHTLASIEANPPNGIVCLNPWILPSVTPDPTVRQFHERSLAIAAEFLRVELSPEKQNDPLPVFVCSNLKASDWPLWLQQSGAQTVASLCAPVGDNADALSALLSTSPVPSLIIQRPYDREIWPKATRGFFNFKEGIPDWVRRLPELD
jgi:deoxyribodipyrimidine photo-lyase